jgi:DNA invertase Pin-like site-specific DNA recombinase
MRANYRCRSHRHAASNASEPLSETVVPPLGGVTRFRYGRGMAHLLGYARVSTAEQEPALQRDALLAAGCARVWVDVASGSRDDRPQLAAVLEQLLPGDTLVVWRLDRLGHSLRHLIDTVTALDERAVGFRSLQESIDTTTSGGQLVFHLFGALAEFERDLIRDRTLAGLEAARQRGRRGGRPTAMTPAKQRQAERMYADKTPVTEIAAVLGVGRATVYRSLKTAGDVAGAAS